MPTKDANNAVTSGLEQLNAVFQAWWTLPAAAAPSTAEAPMQQFADFASDLRKFYADAFNRNRDLLLQGTTALSDRIPGHLLGGQPQEAMKIPLKMLALFCEASSQRAEIWTDLSKQVGARYAALAHQMARDVDQTAATPGAAKPVAAPLPAGKKAR